VTVVGILPAAGSGVRLGSLQPKAFISCAGRPLFEWSLDVLTAACDRVVVAVPDGLEGPDGWVVGGSSRSESVRLALMTAPEATVAVVHDAARPLVTVELVHRCLAALGGPVDAAVAAAPMTDTVKETDDEGRVLRTLDRARLWSVQTPQVFSAEVLRRALDTDSETLRAATDDASLVERIGGTVQLVEAPPENLKVTHPGDLAAAERLLSQR